MSLLEGSFECGWYLLCFVEDKSMFLALFMREEMEQV